mgnify:FL=1
MVCRYKQKIKFGLCFDERQDIISCEINVYNACENVALMKIKIVNDDDNLCVEENESHGDVHRVADEKEKEKLRRSTWTSVGARIL